MARRRGHRRGASPTAMRLHALKLAVWLLPLRSAPQDAPALTAVSGTLHPARPLTSCPHPCAPGTRARRAARWSPCSAASAPAQAPPGTRLLRGAAGGQQGRDMLTCRLPQPCAMRQAVQASNPQQLTFGSRNREWHALSCMPDGQAVQAQLLQAAKAASQEGQVVDGVLQRGRERLGIELGGEADGAADRGCHCAAAVTADAAAGVESGSQLQALPQQRLLATGNPSRQPCPVRRAYGGVDDRERRDVNIAAAAAALAVALAVAPACRSWLDHARAEHLKREGCARRLHFARLARAREGMAHEAPSTLLLRCSDECPTSDKWAEQVGVELGVLASSGPPMLPRQQRRRRQQQAAAAAELSAVRTSRSGHCLAVHCLFSLKRGLFAGRLQCQRARQRH